MSAIRRFAVLLTLVCTQAMSLEAPHPAVDPVLAAHQRQWIPARIEHVTGPVHMATGFGFSNIVFVEGDTSTIVIDWGMIHSNTEKALQAYRTISDKPIKTLILTHPHGDHFSGVGGLFPQGIPADVAVIGPANAYMEENRGHPMQPYFQGEMYRGLYLQMGVLLPPGPTGSAGLGVSPHVTFGPRSGIPSFTHSLSGSESMTIDGIAVEFVYAPGDLVEHYAIWLPDHKVLITGDLPSLPFFVTPRQELTRDIDNIINSTRMLAEFPAEHTLYMHSSRIYRGEEGQVMLRDAHEYLTLVRDQTYRAINNNRTPEDLIAGFPMPQRFADNPDMRDHYHHFSWMLRGLYTKKVGWFTGDVSQMVKPLAREESLRMAQLAGGEEALWSAAKSAYEGEDFGWSVQLATHLIRLQPDNDEYRQLKAYALRAIAYRSHSAIERHYLLTDALAAEGKIDPADLSLVADAVRADVLGLPVATILDDYLGARLRAEDCLDYDKSITIEIIDEQQMHSLRVRDGVATHTEGATDDAINGVQLNAADFYEIFLGKMNWKDAIEAGRVELSGDADSFYSFINLFDWQ